VTPAKRFENVEISLIRQINALATPSSINLGIGEPNVEPDENLRKLAVEAAEKGSWHYTANAGTLSLRELIAGDSGFEPNEVCVTAGTEEALFSIFQAYVDPGDEVLVPNPGFLAYATLARIAGATPVTYDLEPASAEPGSAGVSPAVEDDFGKYGGRDARAPGTDWRVDIDALLKKITAKTKLIVVNSPSNPLGSVIDSDTLRKIANAGPLVVSDEVYREIWYDEKPASMLGMSENVIVVGGMSKSHAMTGLRLGWAIAPEAVMKPIVMAHQYIATCASAFSQSLAEEILRRPDWNRSWLDGVRAQFRKQRDTALSAIERELEVAIAPPAGAFYAFVPVPACDTVTFAKTLATDAAVLVIPGVAFGSLGEGFVRISYAAKLDDISRGIGQIGQWLRAAGR
jgi:aspartate aminotransferase